MDTFMVNGVCAAARRSIWAFGLSFGEKGPFFGLKETYPVPTWLTSHVVEVIRVVLLEVTHVRIGHVVDQIDFASAERGGDGTAVFFFGLPMTPPRYGSALPSASVSQKFSKRTISVVSKRFQLLNLNGP